ncbi:MAG: alpha/beta hydrolase [Acidimicrobiales bacterium]
MIRVNGVDLRVAEEGEGPLVVLAHGFPELAYSWRHQLPALAAAGYHAVAPDQRGYGGSTCPAAVADYDIRHLTGDLVELLDELGEADAVVVGHDWGSMVAGHLAVLEPARVRGLVNMSVPYLRRGPVPPLHAMRQAIGDNFFYILYFQEPGVADSELGREPARTMRCLLCGARTTPNAKPDEGMFLKDGRGFIDRIPEPNALPAWLDQVELDHYIEEFTRTGFTGGINWYRNFDRNWEITPELAEVKVEVPSLFIGGELDPVLAMTPPAAAHPSLTDHRGDVIVAGAGHWVQQEARHEVNAALIAFLDDIHHRVTP